METSARVLMLFEFSSNDKVMKTGERIEYDVKENMELIINRFKELIGHTPVAICRKTGDNFSFNIRLIGHKTYGEPKAEQILTDKEYDKVEPKEPVKIVNEEDVNKSGTLANQDKAAVASKEEKK